MSEYYGWIKKVNTKKTNMRGSGTKTADYFKYYFEQNGLKKNEKHRSKNLYSSENGNFYILSIGSGKTMWAPYPFIKDINNLCLVLTRDTGECTGDVWIVELDDVKDLENSISICGVELSLTPRENAGAYYSLSMKALKEIRKNENKLEVADYSFNLNANNDENRIENIVRNIIG